MKLSRTAGVSIMMGLQKCLLEQKDFTSILLEMNFEPNIAGTLDVVNPPVVHVAKTPVGGEEEDGA